MKNILIATLSVLSLISSAQDTTFYDNDWNKVETMYKATYYRLIQQNQIDTSKVKENTYFKSGQLRTEKDYSNYRDNILDGKLKEWYETGQLRKDIDYKDGKLNGMLSTYWDNGNPKRVDVYENGELITGTCTDSDGTQTTYYDYIKYPKFPGGSDELKIYLSREIKYPKKAEKNDIEGRVLVGFIVNKNGSLLDIEIVNSVSDELDEEAIRVVKKMPNWLPGQIDGETARFAFNLPVVFRLE